MLVYKSFCVQRYGVRRYGVQRFALWRSAFDIIHEIVYFIGVHYGFAEQNSIILLFPSILQSFNPSFLHSFIPSILQSFNYSYLSASMGFTLTAFLAGIIPATAPATTSMVSAVTATLKSIPGCRNISVFAPEVSSR